MLGWQTKRNCFRIFYSLLTIIYAAGLTGCANLKGDGASAGPQTPQSLELKCADWSSSSRGPYRVENNTWGKRRHANWSQCVGIGFGEEGAVTARFTWNWRTPEIGVKAYPEIIFGKKPGARSTTIELPRRLQALSVVDVEYSMSSTYQGTGAIAIDIWMTNSDSPASFSAPPITHEVMIWLDSFGGAKPAGSHFDTVILQENAYDVYVAETHGGGWRYVAFIAQKSLPSSYTLNVMSFLNYLQRTWPDSAADYLSSIEFGVEIEKGRGDLLLHQFKVGIQ